MGIQLLDKTRKINKLLHNNPSSKVVFNDVCAILSDIVASSVLVLSTKGKVLGVCNHPEVPHLSELITEVVGEFIDSELNERLLNILSTKENVNLELIGFSGEAAQGYYSLVMPIEISGCRLGTLLFYKKDNLYTIDDIILGEYGTAIVGLDMMRSVNEEMAAEARKEQVVASAVSTLSYSELDAMVHIFEELGGKEGVLVASKIADRVGITRSVIVNALRKLESAGVIESRSSGMRGTYIKVVNDNMLPALEEARNRQAH